MGTVSENLKIRNRWLTVDPIGRKCGMFVAWSDHMYIKSMRNTDWLIELEVLATDELESCWMIFVHASTETREMKLQ